MIQKGSGEFEIVSGDDIIVTGKVTIPAQGEQFLIDSDVELPEKRIELTGADVYNEFYHRGHRYSGLFKSIKSLSLTEEGEESLPLLLFSLDNCNCFKGPSVGLNGTISGHFYWRQCYNKHCFQRVKNTRTSLFPIPFSV